MRFLQLHTTVLAFSALAATSLPAQTRDTYDSGGQMLPDQAAYDVAHFDLDVRVEPADSSISGTLTMTAVLEAPERTIGLDLDPLPDVTAVRAGTGGDLEAATWERDEGRIRILSLIHI